MADVLATLFNDFAQAQGFSPPTATDGDRIWFRASDRFDICASWVHDEQGVQLMTCLREPRGDSALDAEDPAWLSTSSQEGDWTQLLAWHPPTSSVIAFSRGPAQSLDGVNFPAFVRAFVERVTALAAIYGDGGEDETFNS